jgi:hypothetical protein
MAIDLTQYTQLPYITYETLDEKLDALLTGEVLLVKGYERSGGAGSDVLVRIEEKKFTVSQISYDIKLDQHSDRFWTTFNVGLNDLSLYTCFSFEEQLFSNTNKYMINDIVNYMSEDGRRDSALIEEVYVNNDDPTQFVYRLSRDAGLYAEEDLVQHVYM